MTTREQFLDQLVSDNEGGIKPYSLLRATALWLVLAWGFVVLATLWVQALRPGWFSQLLNHPQFAFETLSGLIAIVLLSLLVFRMGVPASRRRWLLVGTVVATVVWISSFIVGLIYQPALELSMMGKREFCRYETLVFALPPLILGMFYLHRAWVLNWTLSAFGLGALSAMLPAWLMQMACMYDPAHILQAHIAPIIVVGLFGALIGVVVNNKRTKIKPNR